MKLIDGFDTQKIMLFENELLTSTSFEGFIKLFQRYTENYRNIIMNKH